MMTTEGWTLLAVFWTFVTGMTIYCFWLVLRGQSPPGEAPSESTAPTDAPPADPAKASR